MTQGELPPLHTDGHFKAKAASGPNYSSMCVPMHVHVCTKTTYMCVYVFICACEPLCMQTCLCICDCVRACMQKCTSSSSPHASRGPAQEKNPNTFRPERKTDFLDESPLVKRMGPFIFLVIIIYSRHIDNAPTQTLQGIIHSVRGDVAAPQIVQTTSQSPEPHNSMSKGKKKPYAHHYVLILRISPLGTKCILTGLTAQDRRNLGHLNLQLL